MNHKLIEQRLKKVIIDISNDLLNNKYDTLTPDDLIYYFNENGLYIVDIVGNSRSEERKMEQYICDECETVIPEPKIVLIEITGSDDSILVPGTNAKKEFCTPECFWKWTRKNYIPFADGL